jgi:uncharacterized protein YjbI with pentapeptide repeats
MWALTRRPRQVHADEAASGLTGSNLAGAVLTRANQVGANLSTSNLSGATGMAAATLTGVTWDHTACPDGTNCRGGACISGQQQK